MNSITAQAEGLAKKLIRQAEGTRYEVYKCTEHHQTIGTGHKLTQEEIENNTYAGRTISDNEELALFQQDFDIHLQIAINNWQDYFEKLSDAQIAVLIDMTFNMGGGFNPGVWVNFAAALKQQNFEKAGDQIIGSKYYGQVKTRGVRNVNIIKTGKI